MKSEFHDHRIQRTRQLIRSTFIQLIGEKGFDAVTIRDISERAQINRGTFYLHYLDKFDLIDQLKDEFIRDVTQMSQSLNLEVLLQSPSGQTAPGFVIPLFEYFQAHQGFLTVMLGTNGDPAFMESIKRFFRYTLTKQMAGLHQTSNPTLPLEFVIAYITSAHLGILQQWLQSGMKQSPQEIASMIYQMTTQGPLRAYVHPK